MPSCFIIMPITTTVEQAKRYNDKDHFEHVLNHLMIPAVEGAGFQAISPKASGSDLIQAEIIRQLETADLVLCDITSSNPNVFFELGVRTAVDQPVSIVKDAMTPAIPFDTAIINVHTYDPSLAPWSLGDEIQKLSSHLEAALTKSEGRNTLWRYFGLTTRAAFQPGESTLEEKVDLVLLQLQGIQRTDDIEVTNNPDANFLLFTGEARRILRQNLQSDNILRNIEITGLNETITIDMKGSPTEALSIRRIEKLAERYGYDVVIKNLPHLK